MCHLSVYHIKLIPQIEPILDPRVKKLSTSRITPLAPHVNVPPEADSSGWEVKKHAIAEYDGRPLFARTCRTRIH